MNRNIVVGAFFYRSFTRKCTLSEFNLSTLLSLSHPRIPSFMNLSPLSLSLFYLSLFISLLVLSMNVYTEPSLFESKKGNNYTFSDSFFNVFKTPLPGKGGRKGKLVYEAMLMCKKKLIFIS